MRKNIIHTGAGDAFAFVKHTGRYNFFKGRRAKLVTPFLAGPLCMKFYFYIYGENNGYLRISTQLNTSYQEERVLQIFGSYGQKWNFGQIFLHFSPTDVYQVRNNVIKERIFVLVIKKQNNRYMHLSRT